jgi:hypothetical protein
MNSASVRLGQPRPIIPRSATGVVHDPNRVDHVKIPHKPPYHTYSQWVLGDQTYIFAYRDIDQQPEDMVAGIYLLSGAHYKLVGSIEHLGEIVTGVLTATLTGAALPDVVFREDCGELHCVVVVRFSDQTAKQIFSFGDRIIELRQQPKATIIATSRIANQVQEFAWDPRTEKFRKIEQHRRTQ